MLHNASHLFLLNAVKANAFAKKLIKKIIKANAFSVNAKANVLTVLCSLRMCGYLWEK